MKKFKLIILCLLLCITAYGCTQNAEPNILKNTPTLATCTPTNEGIDINEIIIDTERWENIRRESYCSILNELRQDSVSESIEKSNAIAEYRVVKEFSFLGIFYYALSIYEDGTGTFKIVIFYYTELLDFTILNKSAKITIEDVSELLATIEENNFWNIPPVHPDEVIGLDGATVFIEGYTDWESHFITMWEPDEEYGIEKIYEAFRDFSEKIAENPLADYKY